MYFVYNFVVYNIMYTFKLMKDIYVLLWFCNFGNGVVDCINAILTIVTYDLSVCDSIFFYNSISLFKHT